MEAELVQDIPIEVEARENEVEVDSTSEDTSQSHTEEPEQQIEKVRKNAHNHISSLSREKYQLQSENEYLRQQNAQLQQAASATLEMSTKQYNDALIQRMARLKDEKIKAREEGDVNAEADADMAIGVLASELNRAHHLQQPSFTPPPQPQYVAPPIQTTYAGALEDWGNKNTWFHPASADYDPELRQHIDSMCAQFDNNLRRAGQEHMILSPEYLAEVDKAVSQAKAYRAQQYNGELDMNEPRGNVSSIRRGGGAPQAKKSVSLSPSEVQMVKSLGIDPKDYVKSKLQDQREHPEWWR